MKRRRNAGMTIPELIISMGILLLVLGLATVLFKQAFTHNTLTSENLNNEQQTRIALARINNSLSQASVEANASDFIGTPAPPVVGDATFPLAPLASPTQAIAFYRVQTLIPAALPSPGGVPEPNYNVHIIAYDPVLQAIDEYVMPEPSYAAASPSPSPCPTAGPLGTCTILATNVTSFGILEVNSFEFQFTVTINNVLNPAQPETPYTQTDNVTIYN